MVERFWTFRIWPFDECGGPLCLRESYAPGLSGLVSSCSPWGSKKLYVEFEVVVAACLTVAIAPCICSKSTPIFVCISLRAPILDWLCFSVLSVTKKVCCLTAGPGSCVIASFDSLGHEKGELCVRFAFIFGCGYGDCSFSFF